MKVNQAVFWRVVSALIALIISLGFYWLAIANPSYGTALIFVSFVIQVLIYMAYRNRFP